jgi:hypothetical protein
MGRSPEQATQHVNEGLVEWHTFHPHIEGWILSPVAASSRDGRCGRAEKVAVFRALWDFMAPETGEHQSLSLSPWRRKFALFDELAAEFNAQRVVLLST